MTAAPHDAKPIGLFAARLAGQALSRKTRMLLERGDSPRSGERVWRNSYTVGTIEDRVWKPIHDGSRRGGRRCPVARSLACGGAPLCAGAARVGWACEAGESRGHGATCRC